MSRSSNVARAEPPSLLADGSAGDSAGSLRSLSPILCGSLLRRSIGAVGYNGPNKWEERRVKQIWDSLIMEHPVISVIGALLVVTLTYAGSVAL